MSLIGGKTRRGKVSERNSVVELRNGEAPIEARAAPVNRRRYRFAAAFEPAEDPNGPPRALR
jgi:hypothetical protein